MQENVVTQDCSSSSIKTVNNNLTLSAFSLNRSLSIYIQRQSSRVTRLPLLINIINVIYCRFQYWVLSCLGPSLPRTYLVSMSSETVRELDRNNQLKDLTDKMAWPIIRNISLDLGHEHRVPVRLYIPPDYHPREVIKYPLLLHM